MRIDGGLTQQVFDNLLDNASRYARKKIDIACSSEDGHFIIQVSDDGKGFKEQIVRKAVAPYNSTETNTEHFGLVLYISKILCEKHGGEIILENSENGGAVATAKIKCLEAM